MLPSQIINVNVLQKLTKNIIVLFWEVFPWRRHLLRVSICEMWMFLNTVSFCVSASFFFLPKLHFCCFSMNKVENGWFYSSLVCITSIHDTSLEWARLSQLLVYISIRDDVIGPMWISSPLMAQSSILSGRAGGVGPYNKNIAARTSSLYLREGKLQRKRT